MSEIMNVMKLRIFRVSRRDFELYSSNISKTKLKMPALLNAKVKTSSCFAEVFLQIIFM